MSEFLRLQFRRRPVCGSTAPGAEAAPEVLRAFRELFHPSQPTHLLPAWASPALLDPWMEVWATGGEEEDESPWQ
ncbi:4-diphosphocytidyl-2-C-methyl-D-erythritol kinase [Dissostichus eleginoides]|uniref:4-diphosphocytidyl-2-C-methyl-D-erythritol kinase n=1 Tax=Dissostichus eleginoides TaxID=100907 RepID=A0AAD9B8S2_DISEL|nr:4-diphosphocytidyl-2-C-methyl-D-erythritol kinase [Dissostichus eleginoides]